MSRMLPGFAGKGTCLLKIDRQFCKMLNADWRSLRTEGDMPFKGGQRHLLAARINIPKDRIMHVIVIAKDDVTIRCVDVRSCERALIFDQDGTTSHFLVSRST